MIWYGIAIIWIRGKSILSVAFYFGNLFAFLQLCQAGPPIVHRVYVTPIHTQLIYELLVLQVSIGVEMI